MTAAVLCIGTELTRGEVINSNASWIAAALSESGIEVTALDVVDDDSERIAAALLRLGAEHELLVCTGGLGPTTDDITSQCVAAVLGVPLERDRASLDAIRERMSRFGRAMAPSNEKQADFPRGCTILPNHNGTAPGFAITIGRARAFFLPGVPREMKAMFEESIPPELSQYQTQVTHQIVIRTFGQPESTVNDRLAGIELAHGVTLGYRAHFPEIQVKVIVRAAERSDAERVAEAAAAEVEARLGPEIVYGRGPRGLTEVIGDLLRARNLLIGTAESCTGGLVGAMITEVAGSSAYYAGGIISYSNAVKARVLGVPESMLAQHGAVSAEVARSMAQGALGAVGADVALSITGIAGPGGGSEDKPVGLVHYAVAARDRVVDSHFVHPGPRDQVRLRAAWAALALTRQTLLEIPAGEPGAR
jgi:nicotinamide-nucleotide amidase